MAGHGSAPDKGVNAVEYASLYINKLMELREELKKREPKNSVFTPPYSTLQIGGIKGGLARNVIADQCTVDWEMRPVVPEDGKFVNKNIEAYVKDILLPEMKKVYPKAKIEKEIIGEIIGFTKEEKSDAIISFVILQEIILEMWFLSEQKQVCFKSLALVLLFVVLDQLNKLTQLMNM